MKPKLLLSALLLLVFVIALLPTLGIFTASDCSAIVGTSATQTQEELDGAVPKRLALGVRVSDAAMTKALRDVVTARLSERGVGEIVENPVTWPRLDVTLTEMSGRWTPFYAHVLLKGRVFYDVKKQKRAHDLEVTVQGACTGLVGKEEWQDAFITAFGATAVKDIFGAASTAAPAAP